MSGGTDPKHSFGLVYDSYLERVKSERYNQGKPQTREIDPEFIMGMAKVLTASRTKYAEGNWQNETKFSTPYESCMRHLMKFWSGEEKDSESGEHHLLHCAVNLMFLHYHLTSGKGVDDRLFKKVSDADKSTKG